MTSRATSSRRPIVFVHGAWHGAWCWAALQAALDERGLASYAIDLPGHGASTLPAGDLHGDADHVADVLDHLTLTDVVLVGHSYGGAVITDVAKDRGDIAHLVYVAAFALRAGESVMDPLATLPPETTALQSCMVGNEDGTFTIDPAGAVAAFYGQCSPPVAQSAIARLDPQPMATFTQPTRGASDSIASTYVLCARDGAVHPNHQALLSERCDERVDLDADHSPMISAVGELTDVIAAIASRSPSRGRDGRVGPVRLHGTRGS
jgi:pimeloyl-ACP methyl ester carboxylesterase